MRNAAVAGTIAVVVALLVWSGVHNRHARAAEEQAAQTKQMNLVVEKGATATAEDSSGLGANLRGKPAAIFTLSTLDGKRVALKDFKGKPVLLNFWATWCAPCKVEMPWFQEFQQKYAAQGLQVVGVNEDEGAHAAEVRKDITGTLQKLGVSYPILLTDHKIDEAYGGLDQLPATFYIDRDGKIAAEAIGLASKDEAEANVKKIVGTGS